MGFVVAFSINGCFQHFIGDGWGLDKVSADRIVEDLERQGVPAIVIENEWQAEGIG